MPLQPRPGSWWGRVAAFLGSACDPFVSADPLPTLAARYSTTLVHEPLLYAPGMQDLYTYRASGAWVDPGVSVGSTTWGCLRVDLERHSAKILSCVELGRSTPSPLRPCTAPNLEREAPLAFA